MLEKPISFEKVADIPGKLGRAGIIHTPHGDIETPAFIVVGTKATVKALSPEQVRETGAQVVLANTYHLYLQPGDELVKKSGGLHKMMNWNGPTMTDSGGFQVFSLGAAFDKGISKVVGEGEAEVAAQDNGSRSSHAKPAKIEEDGVTFYSHIDGSQHVFTPERSMQIQHNLGADIIFAFDECTSPTAPHEYQKEAMERTHRWAQRSLEEHIKLGAEHQGLFGIVQGGRFEDLRKESAKIIGGMDGFSGFGIGGSFNKKDMGTAVHWVNEILPENKPRHLLGIGEPIDLFEAVENGCDTFDCVSPTRIARNGAVYTKLGRINLKNAKYTEDFSPLDTGCNCYTCKNYTKSYLAHLFKAEEMFAATLASIHNIHFLVSMVQKMRQSILEGNFEAYKKDFLEAYYSR